MTVTDTPKIAISVNNLSCHFTSTKGPFYKRQVQVVRALENINFDLIEGQTLGIVGESGSGKSTLARCIMRLQQPTTGEVLFSGKDIAFADETTLKPVRREMQMVFQDPWASLNPRHTVGQIISEPWEIHPNVVAPDQRKNKVAELLQVVGLDPSFAHRYPSQFSGGQRQRISIARALALSPKVLILDEAVSALDVSVQAQVLNLLAELQTKLGMTYLFISHDLSVVRHICHNIGVMYLGRMIEIGTTEDIFDRPEHPYTKALLSAMPDAEVDERIILEGEVPSPLNPPSGCGFRTRCWRANAQCSEQSPSLDTVSTSQKSMHHRVACFHPLSNG